MQHIGFGLWSWIVVIVYLVAMLSVGAHFTKRASQDTDSFFKASGRLPPRAIGFSTYATTLNAITLTSTPGKAFLTDWVCTAGNIAVVIIIPILIAFYVPFFKKLHVISAYEYLEVRFGPSIRLIGSLLFIIFHSGRTAIVIYLPTLAVTAAPDTSPYTVVSLVGILCILYTFLGGFEGVVWSDFTQGAILLDGTLPIIIVSAFEIKGGFDTIIHDAIASKKILSVDNWRLNSAAAAIPIIFLENTSNNLHQYIVSQDVVQRYQVSESTEETKRSLWTDGVLALISASIFYGMGTMMYLFYQHQETLSKGFNTSLIVPYFILTEVPPFVGGLPIVAIFAVAQSTISSSLNSISACIFEDIKHRSFEKRDDKSEVKLAWLITVIAGLLSYGISMYLIAAGSNNSWDLFLLITGLFGVPLTGTSAVEIFTRRTNTFGVIVGLSAGVIIAYLLHGVDGGDLPFYVSTTSFLVAFILGYIVGLLVPSKNVKDITGLTTYDKNKASTYISKIARRN